MGPTPMGVKKERKYQIPPFFYFSGILNFDKIFERYRENIFDKIFERGVVEANFITLK